MTNASHQDFEEYFSDVSRLDDIRDLNPSDTYTIGQVSERLGGIHPNTIRNWTKLYANFYSAGARTTEADKNRNRVFTHDDLLITNTIHHLIKSRGLRAVSEITSELENPQMRIFTLPHIFSDTEKQVINEERPVPRAQAVQLYSEYRALAAHAQHIEQELATVNQALADLTERYHAMEADSHGKILSLSVERERLAVQLEHTQEQHMKLSEAHQTILQQLADREKIIENLNAATDARSFKNFRATGAAIGFAIMFIAMCLLFVAVIIFYETQVVP